MNKFCTYKENARDSYSTYWKSSCGNTITTSAGIDVGFSFKDPLPNAYGKYCRFCGKEILVKEK